MHITYERFHKEVASATKTLLILAAIFFGLTMLSAWLGPAQAVESFRGATIALAYAFAVVLTLLILSYLAGAVMRWREHHRHLPH